MVIAIISIVAAVLLALYVSKSQDYKALERDKRESSLRSGHIRKEGTEVRPSVGGIVIYSGKFSEVSGNMIMVLGPKWKIQEYCHMKENFVRPGQIIGHETVIGLLGRTGNAAKTPAHVHYTIVTSVPHFWLYNRVYGNGNQPKKFNWMKMFYFNPAII